MVPLPDVFLLFLCLVCSLRCSACGVGADKRAATSMQRSAVIARCSRCYWFELYLLICVHLRWIFLKTVSRALATPISTLPRLLAQTSSLYDDIFIPRILAESGVASGGLVAKILMLVLWALASTPSSVFGDRCVHVCICVRVSASARMCGHAHVCVCKCSANLCPTPPYTPYFHP